MNETMFLTRFVVCAQMHYSWTRVDAVRLHDKIAKSLLDEWPEGRDAAQRTLLQCLFVDEFRLDEMRSLLENAPVTMGRIFTGSYASPEHVLTTIKGTGSLSARWVLSLMDKNL